MFISMRQGPPCLHIDLCHYVNQRCDNDQRLGINSLLCPNGVHFVVITGMCCSHSQMVCEFETVNLLGLKD